MRPHEIFPPRLIRELIRLAKIDRAWLKWKYVGPEPTDPNEPRTYAATNGPDTWLAGAIQGQGADWFGMHADSIWLADGPKVFKPTLEQCRALENVEVSLKLDDYRQPFPAIMVELPKEYEPFCGVVVCHEIGMLNCVLHSRGGRHDIVTTVGASCQHSAIETSLVRFDPDCCHNAKVASAALRIAVNSCLALANWPIQSSLMYPKEAEADAHFAKNAKNAESRRAAADRFALAVTRIEFTQEVSFHHVEGSHVEGEPTGRQVSTHWRRGHWFMAAVGVGRAERRLTFRRATMVRSDLFRGDTANTSAHYKG